MPTRRLILLRHAQAEPAQVGQQDRARPLSATGREEASAAGAWLAIHAPVIDRVLVSPATRTQQTWERVATQVTARQVETVPAIYMATRSTLEMLVAANADVGALLLVGHNPGLEELTTVFAAPLAQPCRGMATAGIALFTLDADGIVGAASFWQP